MSIHESLRSESARIATDLTAWQRHLHAHPEISFQEKATTAFIAETLRSFGITTVRTGFGPLEVGVLAEIGAGSPCIVLRADMDALPVAETTGLAWASTNPGVSHACGHDAHMATLLATARILKAHEAELPGTVRLIFQPAEETGMIWQGASRPGASFVVESGALDGAGAAIALHVFGTMPAGTMNIRAGTAMLAAGFFKGVVHGKGCHGATPHLGIDPITTTAAMLGEFQTIIAREIDPLQCAVLSVCSIHAGHANNVVPAFCEFSGTLRAEQTDTIHHMADRMRAIADATAAGHRCRAEYVCDPVYPAVLNDAALTAFVKAAGVSLLGATRVLDTPPVSVSEDFTLFGAKIPAVMFFWGLGTGQPQHDPAYRMDESTLPDAAATLAACAWDWLKR